MAQLVGGYTISHSSFMVSQPELVDPGLAERCFAAFAKIRDEIADLKPDAIVLIGTDHFNTFSTEAMPQWCVGRSPSHSGWADNLPMYEVAGDASLAEEILESVLEHGFEPAFSDSMRLDHSFFGPLHFLTPDLNVPVVPIFQNTLVYPLVTLRRAYEFGAAIARAIATNPTSKHVVIVGSGGLSHWIGGPQHGRLSPDFDRKFLERFTANDVDWLTGLTDEIETLAGNGGQEIRNWLTIRGALADAHALEVYYEPAYEWIVGVGVAALSVRESSR